MIVQVRLFAAVRQTVGEATLAVELQDEATVGDLRCVLVKRFPALVSWERHLLFAVNEEFATDDHPLAAGADIACFPPVSGG